MIFSPFERLVAMRYLRARRQEGFISVIAGFSLLGIALGVATLIIVLSVMNVGLVYITSSAERYSERWASALWVISTIAAQPAARQMRCGKALSAWLVHDQVR